MDTVQITALIGAAASLLCTLVVGALAYFIKRTLSSLEDTDKKNAADIQAAADAWMRALEDSRKKTDADIKAEAAKREQELKELAGHLNDLKSDMPLVYTLREDFIRSMNSVDHNISGLDQKLDQVLRLITSFGKEG